MYDRIHIMKCKIFIGHNKEFQKRLVHSFLVGAKDISVLNIKEDMDYATAPGAEKTYRTMIYYVKKERKDNI